MVTKKQEREIYCIKHGHAKFVTTFLGYVYCGRCGQQIGDTLCSINNYMVIGHKCETYDKIRKTLSKSDLKIAEKLEKEMEIEEIKEDTKKGFESVKQDVSSVSGWIKHLDSEKNLQKKEIEDKVISYINRNNQLDYSKVIRRTIKETSKHYEKEISEIKKAIEELKVVKELKND